MLADAVLCNVDPLKGVFAIILQVNRRLGPGILGLANPPEVPINLEVQLLQALDAIVTESIALRLVDRQAGLVHRQRTHVDDLGPYGAGAVNVAAELDQSAADFVQANDAVDCALQHVWHLLEQPGQEDSVDLVRGEIGSSLVDVLEERRFAHASELVPRGEAVAAELDADRREDSVDIHHARRSKITACGDAYE